MDKSLINYSKYLSLVLRHQPEKIGIKLDQNGWTDIDELLEGFKRHGVRITFEILCEIVETNDKKRFSFNDDRSKIRANQGHSLDIDLQLESVIPPDVLYHGSASRFVNSILEKGLVKSSRQFVHLSSDYETAVKVGKRHGKPVVLLINSKKMSEEGNLFYLSKNGVWLTDNVPEKFISTMDKVQ